MNFKRDSGKRAKVEHQTKTEQVEDRPSLNAQADSYDSGELTRGDNPLCKTIVPANLLREFQDFEIRLSERMASLNPPHDADYDRCMFCWLKHTMEATNPWMREAMGRFLLFTGAHYEMYYSTTGGSKCIECDGPLPLGKNEATGADRSEF